MKSTNFIKNLLKGPALPVEKKIEKKMLKFFFWKQRKFDFFSLKHPPGTLECPRKMSAQSVQPFGRL